jgi:AraC family transcriptional activator of pyochelin receptor
MASQPVAKARADVSLFYSMSIPGTGVLQARQVSGTDGLFPELYFVLDGKSAGEYNIIYFPVLQDGEQPNTPQNNMTMLSVVLPFAYLQQLILAFPALSFFLDKVQKGIACQLSDAPGTAQPGMLLLARNILNCPFSGELKNIYLDLQISILLTVALSSIGVRTGKKRQEMLLKPQDIEKIQATRDYLFQNMEKPLTLIALAHKMGLNDFKLKKGYKQLYGATLFDDFLHARMQKASQLLTETSDSIVAIAETTGYSNVSSFSVAFKRYFGYTPGTLRKSTGDS